MTHDLRTSEPQTPRRTFENIRHGLESSRSGEATADAIGEQQSKRTQSGSSSRSARNWGAAVEADAIGEQQPKRMQ